MKARMKKFLPLLALTLLIMLGSYLRLAGLGSASMGADRMEYYRIAARGISSIALMHNSDQYIGNYIPFWYAAVNLFVQTFRLDVNFLTVRLLTAITGIGSIFAFYFLGRQFGGVKPGLLAAFFVTLHPLHIQMSRDGYYYAPIALGVVLMLWGIMLLIQAIESKEPPPIAFYILVLCGFIPVSFINPSSWPLAFVAVVTIYVVMLKALISHAFSWSHFFFLSVGFFVVGLPLLIYPWGIRWALWNIGDETYVTYWRQVMGEKTLTDVLKGSLFYLNSFTFGHGILRATGNAFVLLLAVWYTVTSWKTDRKSRVLVSVFASYLFLFIFAYMKSPEGLGLRRFSSYLPFTTLMICMGYQKISLIIEKRLPTWAPALSHGVLSAYCVILLAAFAMPAKLSLDVEGGPPYMRISEWVDANLPEGTLILSDHWHPPWNEFQVNPATNIFYTFTVPNLTPDEYIDNHWRDSALQFLDNNPFAAYYDTRFHWSRIGSWTEPYERFTHRKDFVDEAHVKLSRIGLSYHNALDLNRPIENMTVSIYYNTAEDVLELARSESRKHLVGFGANWRYLKPWRPMQGWPEQLMQALWLQAGLWADGEKTITSLADLQRMPQQQAIQYLNTGLWADYRIPGEHSPLRLFNLTDQDLAATLSITAIALTGNIHCRIDGQGRLFPQAILTTHTLPLNLKPGENEVTVSVRPNQLLLVHAVRLIADGIADESHAAGQAESLGSRVF